MTACLLSLGLGSFPLGGQAPAQKPPAPQAEKAGSRQGEPYTYRSEGRRDPFVSLVRRGADAGTPSERPAANTLAGLAVDDVVLKGILKNDGTYIALVQGPNTRRTFLVRPQDRLLDGVVKAVTMDALVIVQDVSDPLSLKKQQEVVKTLREK